MLRLVNNPGTVLLKASSMWAAYGALAVDVGIKVLEYVRDHKDLKWQDMLLPIILICIPIFRVVHQDSVREAEITPAPKPLKE